ncbi:MAG: GLPGLI family protein [Saprospiraceae bacterium]|nr:GLPGLI family protein [Saprospiraceae bacterium]
MKNFFVLVLMLFAASLTAQVTGEIIYEETVDIHRRLTGDRAQFKEMMPQFRTDPMILLFDDHQAVYRAPQKKEEDIDVEQEGRGRMRMRFMGPAGGILWQNYAESKSIEERDFMDKKFLIKGESQSYMWKLTGESMQVGQYECQKATFEDSTQQVVAWFTPMIPVPLGPGEWGQLPGLILHVDINNGERTITAQEINLKPIDSNLIEEPQKGKEVTGAEFREIVRVKMEEMRAQNGGRGPGGWRQN